MERNTILAIILSVFVIVGFSIANAFLFAPTRRTAKVEDESLSRPVSETSTPDNLVRDSTLSPIENEEDVEEKVIVLRHELVEAIFSNRGARVISFRLLNHRDGAGPVDMVNLDFGGTGSFELTWGDWNEPVIDDLFIVRQPDQNVLSFSRKYRDLEGREFTLQKNFKLLPGEYVLQVEVVIQSASNQVPVLPGGDKGWSLILGPQIGPRFEVLDGQKEYRRYFAFANDNLEEIKLQANAVSKTQPLVWAGIAGKYFALIGIPRNPGLQTTWSNQPRGALTNPSLLVFTAGRPATPVTSHVIQVYLGPKQPKILEAYQDLKLVRIIDRNLILGWLEDLLKAALDLFYFLIPNYGVGIILLTIVLRLAMTPLTNSSQRSMAAMAALQPKVQQLQEKYRNDPAKLNEEIARLYQKERINPLGGCLPLLLQLPIFFAFYGLLSSHFELRGAVFIPGWIEDLSLPDSILSFGGWRIPILNWGDLRLLPFIMLGSQFLMSAFTPSPSTGGVQGKIFSVGLPIFFFFLLYEFPSGLVLYWTVTNLLSAASQYYFNTHQKPKPKA